MKNPTQESFLNDVKDHVLTVNLDHGVYRDMHIGKPNSSDMHYNITTRPGYLMFTGDMGSFVFNRLSDMFVFFRGKRINLGYWEEKLTAVDGRRGAKEFDSEKAKNELQDCLAEFIKDLDVDDDEFREKVINATVSIKDIDYSDEYSLVGAIRDWDPDIAGGLDLSDFFEASVDSYTYRYVWCCYAIMHAIKLYDEAKFVGPVMDKVAA